MLGFNMLQDFEKLFINIFFTRNKMILTLALMKVFHLIEFPLKTRQLIIKIGRRTQTI